MKRRERRYGCKVRPLKFSSWDEAFRYAKEDVKGPVVVEMVAPAPAGPGVYHGVSGR